MPDYRTHSDQELTELLRSGDHAAFTEIYDRFKSLLYAHAYNKLRNREEARDILQELFSQLWNNHQTLEISTSLSGYLYGSIRNQVFKLIRHKDINSRYYSSIQQSIEKSTAVTDHLVREKQLAEIIEDEINDLPEKMREIFLLSRKQNLSHREIASQLGIAETTVKKQVNNALRILRAKLSLIAWVVFLIRY